VSESVKQALGTPELADLIFDPLSTDDLVKVR